MQAESPEWLRRLVVGLFWTVLLGISGLALALRAGLADPKPLGRELQSWKFDDLEGWDLIADPRVAFEPDAEGLQVTFPDPHQTALVLREMPSTPLTLEVSAAQSDGAPGLVYGLAFGYSGPRDYNVVWLNGNGYAEALSLNDGEAATRYEWQQWPHILPASETNRVRVDVGREGAVTARINDELLTSWQGPAFPEGWAGIAARSQAAGSVTFFWVKAWSE